MNFLPLTVPNVKIMIDFASDQGLVFMEVRDPEAKLTLGECKELATYARLKHVEAVYALNVGAMASNSNYFEVLARGIANTLVFDGPKMIRSGCNGPEFISDEKKIYWMADEFAQLVQNINQAGNTAKMFGLSLSVENAREAFCGDGINTFGISQLFGAQGVNTNVDWQLDVANFFSVSRLPKQPNEVKGFFEENVGRISYTHLKSSIEGENQPILCGNDLSFDVYLDSLAKNNKVYVVIELTEAETLEAVYDNHRKSIAYLTSSY